MTFMVTSNMEVLDFPHDFDQKPAGVRPSIPGLTHAPGPARWGEACGYGLLFLSPCGEHTMDSPTLTAAVAPIVLVSAAGLPLNNMQTKNLRARSPTNCRTLPSVSG